MLDSRTLGTNGTSQKTARVSESRPDKPYTCGRCYNRLTAAAGDRYCMNCATSGPDLPPRYI